MTQQEAVEKALAALGPEAQPSAIRAFIKSECKLDIGNAAISSLKWSIRKGAKKNGHSGLTASDIQSLKLIMARVGPEELGRVIEVLK